MAEALSPGFPYPQGGSWASSLRWRSVLIAAAEKKAAEIGQPMNIAVVDAAATSSPTFAWIMPGSAQSTSRSRRLTPRAPSTFDTKDLAEHSQSGGQFFGIHASNDGNQSFDRA